MDLQSIPFNRSGTYPIPGADGGNQTPDHSITNRMLYHLSYIGKLQLETKFIEYTWCISLRQNISLLHKLIERFIIFGELKINLFTLLFSASVESAGLVHYFNSVFASFPSPLPLKFSKSKF